MRYGSVCSGIEAATAAWHPLGWSPAWFAEIDAFPSAVLAHHYPDVPNLGDFTRIGAEHGPVDLIVGGTPCQDFSVAGQRAGMAGSRGALSWEFVRLLERIQPRWVVWENVPGVLSSNGGRDFAAFIGELSRCGYGLAWRVLDARYFGVPQRRRRVFLVGYFGDWRRAVAVLFERESLCRDFTPRGQAREDVAALTAHGVGVGGDDKQVQAGHLIAGTVSSKWAKGTGGPSGDECQNLVAHSLRGAGHDASEDGTGRGTPIVPVAFDCKATDCQPGDVSPTMRAMNHSKSHANAGGQVAVAKIANVPAIVGTLKAQGTHDSSAEAVDRLVSDDSLAARRLDPTQETMIPVAFNLRGREGGSVPEETDVVSVRAASGGSSRSYVLVATEHKGMIGAGGTDASTQETDAVEVLCRVREALGEKAFAEWGLGILDSLQRPEILQQALHGIGIRQAAFSKSWVVHCALSCPEDLPARALQSLREAKGSGCTPQGWEPSEQLAGKLGAYLSKLSQPGAQAERFMRDLWQAAEGLGVLRKALSAVQEIRRSSENETQPAYTGYQVRRLVPVECEFLQGFPRNYTASLSDTQRYRALGNSMAVPVMRWIGQRIAEQLNDGHR